VSCIDGGVDAWAQAGLPFETGADQEQLQRDGIVSFRYFDPAPARRPR
jgi:hypothetical protein